jgi:cysteine desulfurase / selenocysteine lyase
MPTLSNTEDVEQKTLIDWDMVRRDFPILSQTIGERPLVYLDSAASSQIPRYVVNSMSEYYFTIHSNVHRGIHTLSQRATNAFDQARARIAAFIGAGRPEQCIFVRGATEGVNLVAHSFGNTFVKQGDEILVTELEHHSNIVPWQMLAARVGAKLKVVPVDRSSGDLDLEAFRNMLSEKVKIVAVTHVSNVLGTVNPIKDIITLAHERGCPILIDGCQALLHAHPLMSELDPDFYVFSGHKMCAPTGIGILYMKDKWLDLLPPFLGGGDMISSVTFEHTEYNEAPYKFEAGTPPIVGAVALGATVEYLNSIGRRALIERERYLAKVVEEKLNQLPGITIYGKPVERAAVFSFTMEGVHHQDVGAILDSQGIAVRVGQHCAEPLMHVLGVSGTVRASFTFYNSLADIDAFIEGLTVVRDLCACTSH